MHENILQSVGNRQMPSGQRLQHGGFGLFHDVYGRQTTTKTSAIVQPMTSSMTTQQNRAKTPEKENHPIRPYNISPVMPVAGSVSHNIMRMLSESYANTKEDRENRAFSEIATSNMLPTFRQKLQYETESENGSKIEEDNLAVNDSTDHLRSSDLPNITDSSISTQGSTSPRSTGTGSSPSGSTNSSPGSGCDPVVSPDITSQDSKKKNRTNYTTEQVQKLLKIFHDNPYPDSEMMEEIGKDMGIPENKIKIWFQNKRARWRRRVNDNMNIPHHLMSMSPMLSPVGPYGFVPTGHMMTSSPPHPFPGYMNYPWIQAPISPNNNNPQTSQIASRLHPANQTSSQRLQSTNQNSLYGQSHYPTSFQAQTPISSNPSLPYQIKSTQPNMLASQPSRTFSQYSPCLYSSAYSNGTGQIQQ